MTVPDNAGEREWKKVSPKLYPVGWVHWKTPGDWVEGPVTQVWKGTKYQQWNANILLRDFELHDVRARVKEDCVSEADLWIQPTKGDVVAISLNLKQLSGTITEEYVGFDAKIVYLGIERGARGLPMKQFQVQVRPPPGQEPERLDDY